MGMSGILYILVALFGYLSFYDQVKGDVLLNYNTKDIVIGIGRFGLALCLLFGLPLLTVPMRMYVREFLKLKKEQDNVKFRVITSLIVYIFCYGVSILVPGILIVWSFFGSTIGVVFNYILPGILYWKVSKYPWYEMHTLFACIYYN